MNKLYKNLKDFFIDVYTSGKNNSYSVEIKQKVILINIIITITVLYILTFSLNAFGDYSSLQKIIQLSIAFLSIFIFIHLRKTQNYLINSYLIIIMMGTFFLYQLAIGGIHNTGHMWSYSFPLFVMFLIGHKRGTIIISIFFGFTCLILFMPEIIPVKKYHFDFMIRFIGSFIALFIISILYEKTKDKINKEIIQKNVQLSSTNRELKIIKENLVEQKSLIEEVFAGVQEGIGIINQKKTIVLCNPTFADIFDMDVDSLIGKSFLTFFDKSAQTTISKQTEERKKGKTSVYELQLISHKGNVKDVRISSSPRFFANGSFAGSFTVIMDITERKRVLEQLKESEERYKDLVEKAEIAILIDDEDGNFKYFNKKFTELFGYSKEEMQGQSISTLVHSDDFKEVMKFHKQRLMSKQAPSRYEFRGVRKDGSVLYLEVDAVELEERGRVIGTRSYIRNLTDSKRGEQLQSVLFKIAEIATSEVNLKKLFHSIHTSISELIDAKNFYIAIYNKEEDLLTFPYFVDEVDEDDSPYKPKKGLTEYVIRTGKALLINEEDHNRMIKEEKLELVGPPSKIWVGIPLKSKTETFGAMVVQHYTNIKAYSELDKEMLMIVSEQIASAIDRKKSEEALKESEERYRDLVEKSKIAIVADGKDGNLIFFNKRFANLLGYSLEEMKTQSIKTLTHPDDVERALNNHRNRIQGRKSPSRYELKAIKKDGSTLYLEIDVILLKKRNAIIGTQSYIWDITKRKKAEEKLREYQDHLENIVGERTAELAKSNELLQLEIIERLKTEKDLIKAKEAAEMASQAKGDFLTNVSHEIRTPMNAILGFSELMLISKTPDKNKTYLGLIITESKVLLDIINDLLDIAKVDSGKLDLENLPFDLIQIIKSIKSSMMVRAKNKGLTFKVSIKDGIYTRLIGDPTRLRQILVNLIDNAIKFTKSGSVTVTVKQQEEFGNKVRLYFSVTDTGMGISKKNQSLIFESFTQADGSTTRKYGGTGLGTTISKKLVELMGGEIGVESKRGKGSTFWFTAVFYKRYKSTDGIVKEWDAASLSHEILEKVFKRKERVLLVEDYPTNQEIAKTHLLDAGYKVELATNGKEAVKKAAEKKFDIILMDVQMPDMDGYEATRLIRRGKAKNRNVPIIAITASAHHQDHKSCFDAGMNDIIVKPIRRNQFLSVINRFFSPEGNSKSASEISKPAATSIQKKKNPIDYEQAVFEFGGKKDLVDSVINQFLHNVNSQIRMLKQTLDKRDFDTLRREAHKIHGGALNLTAMPLASIAEQLEKLGESGNLKQARKKLEELKIELNRLKIFLGF